jgi:hypothetical protein
MGKTRHTFGILVEIPQRKGLLGSLSLDGRIILKLIFKK